MAPPEAYSTRSEAKKIIIICSPVEELKTRTTVIGTVCDRISNCFGTANYRVRFQIEHLFTKTEENPRGSDYRLKRQERDSRHKLNIVTRIK